MDFDAFERGLQACGPRPPPWEVFQDQVVPWWLCKNEELRIERYWTWSKWPGRRQHKFLSKDIGIDGVARTQDGALWAVQVKYSDDPHKQLPWAELSTFLGLAARPEQRVFDRRVIVTNTWKPGDNLAAVLRSNPDALWLGRKALLDSPVNWEGVFARSATNLRPRRPRPHQAAAVESITRVLQQGCRAQAHLPCGTGKTLIALWAHERLRSRRTLLLVPTLSLARQVLHEWTANRTRPFEFLTVCSDQTVADDDALVEVASELGIVASTRPDDIAKFLATASRIPKLIITTYQSSPQIAAAQAHRRAPPFDLAICDEAHKTTGLAGSPFGTILDDKRIRAQRRLFMTATPRIYGRKVKRKADEEGFQVFSMDNEEVYGPVAFRMSFAEAIEHKPEPLLSDYRLVVMCVTDEEVRSAIGTRRLVEINGTAINAEDLAVQIAVGKALRRFRLSKLITFHSRVQAAKRFAAVEEPRGLVATLTNARLAPRTLWTAHVSGEMSAGDRDLLLHEFRHAPPVAIMANARCLTEGIDVPATDSIAFIDPRQSKIDIVQAIGRAIRRFSGKDVGTVILPIVIRAGEDVATVIDSSRCEAIGDVLKALRSHDERLGDVIDRYRTALGERRKPDQLARQFFERHVVIDLPSRLSADRIVESINAKLVSLTSADVMEMIGVLRRFVRERGWVAFTYETRFDGVALGKWVRQRRADYSRGRMKPWLASELESIPGWTWSPFVEAARRALDALRAYVTRFGWGRFTQKVRHQAIPIGKWVAKRRVEFRRGHLGQWIVAELEAIPGWVWNPHEARHRRMLDLLRRHVAKHGHGSVTHGLVIDGEPVGTWASRRRQEFKRKRLEPWIKQELETIPGWSWQPYAEHFSSRLAMLRSYVAQHGWATLTIDTVTDGVKLGLWVAGRRHDFKKGSLSRLARSELESIPGWSWEPHADNHRRNVLLLRRWLRGNTWEGFGSGVILDSVNLSSWVGSLRRRYRDRRVAGWLVRELEGIPGWSWERNAVHESQVRTTALAREYMLRHGPIRRGVTFKGVKLDLWISGRRAAYRAKRLPEWQVKALEAIPGWSWSPHEDNHRRHLDLLRMFVEANGWHDFCRDTIIDGARVGQWVETRRGDYRRGKVEPWLRRELEAIPGWEWSGVEFRRKRLGLRKPSRVVAGRGTARR